MNDNASLTGVKVMVIDDSKTIRRSAEIFLKEAGCMVSAAEDGFDALAKIVEQEPHIILCDIMMPRLDGYQTCAIVRQNQRFCDMPFIMLSSKDSVFDRARGLMAGASEYITKPFTRDSLLTAVRAHARQGARSRV